jgi:hypothetical protein
MTSPLLYARVIAGFSANVAPAAIDAVIDLARALGAEVQAVLLEDLVTLALAELPSPRAFDPRDAVWREVRRAELHRQMDLAASMLRRRLQTAQSAGLRAQVNVERGGPVSVLGQYAQAGDLLVITEPADPMARWVQPFAGLLEAALATPAALLYLPHGGGRRRGPVAALGAGVAGRLARGLAQALGAPLIEVEAQAAPAGEQGLRAALAPLRERQVRVVVCERADLAPDAGRSLHEAADQRLTVLLAPVQPSG